MRWKTIKTQKIMQTIDGYYLKVEYLDQSKYQWAIYKDGKLVNSAQKEKNYCESYKSAKKVVVQRMVKHLLQYENVI